MAKLVCIPQPQLDYIQQKFWSGQSHDKESKCSDKSDHCCNGVCSSMSLVHSEPTTYYDHTNVSHAHVTSQALDHSTVELQVAEIRRTMQRIEMRLDEKYHKLAHEASISGEWKAVGTVLDRFFFVIYIILIGASIVVFFPRPNWHSVNTSKLFCFCLATEPVLLSWCFVSVFSLCWKQMIPGAKWYGGEMSVCKVISFAVVCWLFPVISSVCPRILPENSRVLSPAPLQNQVEGKPDQE